MSKEESYERILSEEIKPFGLWQALLFFLFIFPMNITLDLVLVIINIHPDHFYRFCEASSDNSSFLIYSCKEDATEAAHLWSRNHSVDLTKFPIEFLSNTCSQSHYVYSKSQREWIGTLVEEFDLVCDRAYLASLSLSMFMVGQIVACFIVGIMADIYGRKLIIQIFAMLQFVLPILIIFSPNIFTFIGIQFLIGFSVLSSFNTCFILLMEITNSRWRSIVAMLISVNTGIVGVSVMILGGYLAQSWQIFYIAMALVLIPTISFLFFTPESPRWLLIQNRKDEALQLLLYAAQTNAKFRHQGDFDKTTERIKTFVDNFSLNSANVCLTNFENQTSAAKTFISNLKLFVKIFVVPVTRKRILPLMLIWFLSALVYYGCLINSVRIGGNVYLVLWTTGASVAPASITRYFLNKQFESRRIITALFILNLLIFLGVFGLQVFGTGESIELIVIILCLIGAFVMEVVIAMVYAYSPELFPTELRNYSLGICTAASRIASSITPFFIQYSKKIWPPTTMLVFVIVLLLGTIVSIILPDNKGESIPDTVKQMLDTRNKSNFHEELEIFPLEENNETNIM